MILIAARPNAIIPADSIVVMASFGRCVKNGTIINTPARYISRYKPPWKNVRANNMAIAMVAYSRFFPVVLYALIHA